MSWNSDKVIENSIENCLRDTIDIVEDYILKKIDQACKKYVPNFTVFSDDGKKLLELLEQHYSVSTDIHRSMLRSIIDDIIFDDWDTYCLNALEDMELVKIDDSFNVHNTSYWSLDKEEEKEKEMDFDPDKIWQME